LTPVLETVSTMTKNGLAHGIWVLICDGRKALLTENAGDAAAPNLQVRESFEHPDLATHELGSDKPGRIFQSTNVGRSAAEPTDLHRLAEEDFLKKIAGILNKSVSDHRIKNIILVAPPRAIGVLRGALSPAAGKVVRHELEKDYVREPMYEVEKHLVRHLSGSGAGR
jgi:protein required for attachment to host cells